MLNVKLGANCGAPSGESCQQARLELGEESALPELLLVDELGEALKPRLRGWYTVPQPRAETDSRGNAGSDPPAPR